MGVIGFVNVSDSRGDARRGLCVGWDFFFLVSGMCRDRACGALILAEIKWR